MFKRLVFTFAIILSCGTASAADLTQDFYERLRKATSLTHSELSALKNFDFYLVPGILSETFLEGDDRSSLSFARLTGEYFQTQQNLLKDHYGLRSERLSSSSKSVAEIRMNIKQALQSSLAAGRKSVFVTHSLGGLALLEELVSSPDSQELVAGILFLQSPFQGSPIADVYFEKPLYLYKWLSPVIPYFNTTPETIRYLGTVSRKKFMSQNRDELQLLLQKVPVITVGGVANGHSSLFTLAVNINATGCLEKVLGVCAVRTSFKGPYDVSDGMVPFKSSQLEGADFVRLEGVDHGETVVSIPYGTLDKEKTISVLLKLLNEKINQ